MTSRIHRSWTTALMFIALAVGGFATGACGDAGDIAKASSSSSSTPTTTAATETSTISPTTVPATTPPSAAAATSPPPAPERLPTLEWVADHPSSGEPWVGLSFSATTGPGVVTWAHLMRPYSAEGTFSGPINGVVTIELRYSDVSGLSGEEEVLSEWKHATAEIRGNTLIFHEPDDGGTSEFHPA